MLGTTTFRGVKRRFGLLPADRLRHLHVIGKTGVGKSTLLANLMVQDLRAGRGFALIDPHGDLVADVRRHIGHRSAEVVQLGPDQGLTLNPFRLGAKPHPSRARLASALVAIFHSLWADSWGPRLEQLLRAGVLGVSYHPDASLLLLARFLFDDDLRTRLLPRITDPVVQRFWAVEFAGYPKRLQAEALAAVHNKLGALIMHPGLRQLLGGVKSSFDPEAIIARQHVLLVATPASSLGDDGSRLFGALVFALVQLAAWQRPSPQLFSIYADEVQRFVTGTFATTLSEARKFNLGLVMAHQYLEQLPLPVRSAVLGNVGSQAIFRVGGADAAVLARDLQPVVQAADLQRLGRAQAIMTLIARGVPLSPIVAETLPLPPAP